jgi:hypothetical protein
MVIRRVIINAGRCLTFGCTSPSFCLLWQMGLCSCYFSSNMHKLRDAFRAEIDTRLDGLKQNMDARFDTQTRPLFRVEQAMAVRLRVLEQRESKAARELT